MSYAIVNSRLLSFRCNIRLLNRFFKVKATPSEDILLHQHCRRYSSRDKNESNFGQSIILLQDGANFQELPIIVRRVNDELVLLKNVERGKSETSNIYDTKSPIEDCTSYEEVLDCFSSYKTKDVPASMAFSALKKLAEIGKTNHEFDHTTVRYVGPNSDVEPVTVSFTLEAVLAQLIDKVGSSGSSQEIIHSLELISQTSFPGQVLPLQRKLIDSCLDHILDGSCTIIEVCTAIKIFTDLANKDICCKTLADKAWVGVLQSSDSINESNIVSVFQILPLLKSSQQLVLRVLERGLVDCIHKLQADDVLIILNIVKSNDLPSQRICGRVSHWMSLALHTFSDELMKALLLLLNSLEHFDYVMGRNMERYVRARELHLTDQELMVAIAKYCYKTRFNSPTILAGLSSYFVRHQADLSASTAHSILTTLALFNFQPRNNHVFWLKVEHVLNRDFEQFPVESMLDVLMACIYLERYPMNFVPRIFSPIFLRRLHMQSPLVVDSSRAKIKLLDLAMALECPQYTSKILPKDHSAKCLTRDGRVNRTVNMMAPLLQELVGSSFQVSSSVVLSNLPLCDTYLADCLISPCETPLHRYGYKRPGKGAIVILVHPPEHYSHDQTMLIGSQMMRQRHLMKMGFKVIDLSYSYLNQNWNKKETIHQLLQAQLARHFT